MGRLENIHYKILYPYTFILSFGQTNSLVFLVFVYPRMLYARFWVDSITGITEKTAFFVYPNMTFLDNG